MTSRNVSFGLERSSVVSKQQQRQQQQSPISPSPDQSWRKYGKLYRAQITLEDEQKGGNSFVLSNQCSIDRYYRVAERVRYFKKK